MREIRKKDSIPYFGLKIKMIIILGCIALFLLATYYLLVHYTVQNVVVEGNRHYSAKEIRSFVMGGRLGDNSLYLSAKYKNKEITDIPFIASMDIEVVSNDTIKIVVYEKSIAGYVEYLGRYMYFDNDGVVVEASTMPTLGIPQVIGLDFDHVVLYEQLPVEDNSVFQKILSITKLLDKYKVICDKINFYKTKEVVLSYGKIKVNLGNLEDLDDKIMQIPYILPKLEGMSGTLELQNYSFDKKSVSFKKDE